MKRRPQPDLESWQTQIAETGRRLHDLESDAAELRAQLDEALELGATTSELRRQLATAEMSLKIARRQLEEQRAVVEAATASRLDTVIQGLLGQAGESHDAFLKRYRFNLTPEPPS